jgi:hypothetical protein
MRTCQVKQILLAWILIEGKNFLSVSNYIVVSLRTPHLTTGITSNIHAHTFNLSFNSVISFFYVHDDEPVLPVGSTGFYKSTGRALSTRAKRFEHERLD